MTATSSDVLHAALVPPPPGRSTIGPLAAVTTPEGSVVRITFLAARSLDTRAARAEFERELIESHGRAVHWEEGVEDDPTAGVARQLVEYLARDRRTFELSLHVAGTPFQKRVWDALQTIPYGATWSYGQLAERLGSPGGARAVGRANNANPISVVVPCHRVVGADGRLVGFGGGVDAKRALLDLERGQAACTDGLFGSSPSSGS